MGLSVLHGLPVLAMLVGQAVGFSIFPKGEPEEIDSRSFGLPECSSAPASALVSAMKGRSGLGAKCY